MKRTLAILALLLCGTAASLYLFGASGAIHVPSEIGEIIGLRGTIGVNVRDPIYGAKPDGVTDATAAIQKAINDAAAAGGSVTIPAGTYLVSGLQIKSNVELRGSGVGNTVLKLKDGSNADVVGVDATTRGYINIQGANNTGNSGGVTNWGVRDLSIDGNKTNNSSGWGIRVYGYGHRLQNFIVRNCASGGVQLDWNAGQSFNADSLEGTMIGGKIHDNAGCGLEVGGPHDSYAAKMVLWNNNTNLHVGPNASAMLWEQSHLWNSNTGYFGCIYEGGYCYFNGCEIEGVNSNNSLFVFLGGTGQFNGHLFGTSGSSSQNATGLTLGQSGDTTYGPGGNGTITVLGARQATGFRFFGHLSHCAGTSGAINFVNEANNEIIAQLFQTTGTYTNGTPSNSTEYAINGNGLTADGTLALSGGFRYGAKANTGLTITDKAGNDRFNVNANAGKVEAPNNGTITAYTSGYSTIGTRLNFDGAGGIQMGATGAINLSKRGNTLLGINGTLTLQQSGSAQNIATSANITITSSSNQVGVNRISTSGAATGVTMDSGAASGQIIFVVNESANSVTMAASGTSHVANGVGCVIGATTAKEFVWDSITALWYPAQ